MRPVTAWFSEASGTPEANWKGQVHALQQAENASRKSNKNIALQAHKKLDNVTLNMYYGRVSK
jgi:hypothetical protein